MGRPPLFTALMASCRGLHARILAGFAVILCVLWHQGASATRLQKELVASLHASHERMEEIDHLILATQRLRVLAFRVLGTQHADRQAEFMASYRNCEKRIVAASERLGIATAAAQACIACYGEVLTLHLDFQGKKAQELMNTRGQELHDALERVLDAAEGHQHETILAETTKTVTTHAATLEQEFWLAITIALALALALGHWIATPVRQASRVATAMRQGDFSQRVGGRGGSSGSSGSSEVAQLATAVDALSATMQDAVTSIATVTKDLGSAASVLTVASEQAQFQYDAVNAIGTSLPERREQLSSGIEAIASGLSESTQVMQGVAASTRELGTASAEAERSTSALRTTLDELGNNSQAIDEVVQLIRDIAFQTNLLALNAAVEAARAGDAGRGFAIVAEEVRNLAKRTNDATSGIAERIQRIRANTDAARASIGNVSDLLHDVATVQGRVAAAVTSQDATTASLLQTAGKTVGDVQDFVGELEALGKALSSTRSSAGELGTARQDLVQSVARLDALVARLQGEPTAAG